MTKSSEKKAITRLKVGGFFSYFIDKYKFMIYRIITLEPGKSTKKCNKVTKRYFVKMSRKSIFYI